MFDKIYLVFAERTIEKREEELVLTVSIDYLTMKNNGLEGLKFLPRIYTNLHAAQYDASFIFDGEEVDSSYEPKER